VLGNFYVENVSKACNPVGEELTPGSITFLISGEPGGQGGRPAGFKF
jgi:hypothetical protein